MINVKSLESKVSYVSTSLFMLGVSLIATACPDNKKQNKQYSPPTPIVQPSKKTETKPETKTETKTETKPTTKPKIKPTTKPPTGLPGELKLASWNIEWLNRGNGKGRTPRSSEDYAALQRYAKILDADVVALQEVDGVEAARRVFDPNVYDFHFSSRRDNQLVGFAYKKSLKVQKQPDVVDFQLGKHRRLRHGVSMSVQNGQGRPVQLLAVHLKSGCWSSPFDGPVRGGERPEACRILKDQNQVLKKWMDVQRRKNASFVVLGDFNRRLKTREPFWLNLQKSKTRADLVAPTLEKRSNCWRGRYPDYIDHIILGERSARGFSTTSFKQVVFSSADARRHRKTLSDHCPIRITLKNL